MLPNECKRTGQVVQLATAERLVPELELYRGYLQLRRPAIVRCVIRHSPNPCRVRLLGWQRPH